MKEDTYYFPHDTDAQNDPKCFCLLNDFGASGYGTYWVLVEMLHKHSGHLEKFPKFFDGLSAKLKIPKQRLIKQIDAMVSDYRLFEQNDTHIWSNRVLRNIEERRRKYESKVEAGRRGGLASVASSKIKHTSSIPQAVLKSA